MFSNSKNKFSQFFKKNGFVIINIFNSKDIEILKNKIKYKSAKIAKIRKKWDLSQYHKFINSNQNKKITKNSKRFICVNREIINKISKSKIIKDILNNIWGHSNFIVPNQKYLIGKSKKTSIKNIKKNEVQFRVVIPQVKNKLVDAAPPPHVDLNAAKVTNKIINGKKYMDTSSIQLTLWTPLVGFSKNYTLRVAPGSHKINHPTNKISKKNKNYVSPVFENKYCKKFQFKRFDLRKGQAILFDGNLIHGGTKNLGTKSRANLEFRLYNSNQINFYR